LPRLIKRTALILLVLFCTIKAKAQQFFVCTSNQTVERVTINGTAISTQSVGACGSGSYYSIAIFGGKLYHNTDNGELYSGDIVNGNTPQIINCTYLSSDIFGNALTIDKNGLVYFVAGNVLKTFNLTTKIVTELGAMPYYSGGDLIFYKDELYMASTDGIVKVSISNPASSSMYISISGSIYGLSTVLQGSSIKVYALTSSGSGTDMLELDMENKAIKGLIGTLPFTAFDAASGVETGEVPVIEIQDVNVTPQCDVLNKGHAEVICKPHTSQYTFTLNTGEANTAGVFNSLTPGDYHVTITSDGGEVPKETDFTVPDYALNKPVITITKKNPVCDIAGQIKLDARGANTTHNIRFNNQAFGFDHVFTGLAAGTYHFTIITQNGCLVDEKDYTLDQDVCPPIEIEGVRTTAECEFYGEAIVTVITKPHPDNYTYTFNGQTNTTGIFNRVLPGEHNLIITSSGGDRKEQLVILPDYKILNKPDLLPVIKNAICTMAGQVTFTGIGNLKGATTIRYEGALYAIGKTIKGLATGANHFTVLSSQGCILDEVDVTVQEDRCDPVVFPNTFTPNGDGVNDFFRPNQDANPIFFRFVIYNRWGQELFQSASIYNGWDGTSNGKPLPAGVYYYMARYTMGDGLSNVQKGSVTLLK